MEVLDELTRRSRDVLTIVITAYATFDTAVKAMKLGAYDFLAKPFAPDELRYALRKTTDHLILSRQARRLAEEKRQVRYDFISVLAHELKTPLNAVEGYLNILRLAEHDENLRMIERSIARVGGMKRLIGDLLDLTRIESGLSAASCAASTSARSRRRPWTWSPPTPPAAGSRWRWRPKAPSSSMPTRARSRWSSTISFPTP